MNENTAKSHSFNRNNLCRYSNVDAKDHSPHIKKYSVFIHLNLLAIEINTTQCFTGAKS